MNYNLTGKVNKKFILDDSEVTETVNIIENITNRKLNIEIKNQDQLQILLDKPAKLIDDEELIRKVKKFKNFIIKKSTTYYVESK
ncbi:hypothetical protein [Ruoffia sp. FAM 26254]|uniref:hypothetical protein n=1 Tax=Ruoffia sp. FAM 26254 TaxID=3259518 RepID=UPI0038898DF5